MFMCFMHMILFHVHNMPTGGSSAPSFSEKGREAPQPVKSYRANKGQCQDQDLGQSDSNTDPLSSTFSERPSCLCDGKAPSNEGTMAIA